jgi:hypothetical protein
MKFFIILIILCTATATQLKTSGQGDKPNKTEIDCFILKAGSRVNLSKGPYKIQWSQGTTAGLIFKGLTKYPTISSNDPYFNMAFTESQFNSFFVKNGDNYMIPFRFFTKGSTANLCGTCYKWMDFDVQNDSKVTVSFRIQNMYWQAGKIWNQSHRQTFINKVVSVGKTKREMTGDFVKDSQDEASAFFIARFQVASAGSTQEDYEKTLKNKQDTTNAIIATQTAKQIEAQQKLGEATQKQVEAQLNMDTITRSLNLERTNLQGFKIDEKYEDVKKNKAANEEKMAAHKKLFDDNVALIAKLSGPQIADISKNLSDAMKSANDTPKENNNPQQQQIEDNLSTISK